MSRRPHQQAPPQNSQEESMALRVNAIRRYLYRVNSRYQKVAPPRRVFMAFMAFPFWDFTEDASSLKVAIHASNFWARATASWLSKLACLGWFLGIFFWSMAMMGYKTESIRGNGYAFPLALILNAWPK